MLKSSLVCVLLVLYVGNSYVSSQVVESYSEKDNTVIYVTAVFRHGDRTVDAGTEYPLDPYINETYFPFGIGQLTNKGKQRQYNLGTLIRKRYDALLGDIYMQEVLEPLCTSSNRTKASLALVLAAMYPPRGNLMDWNPVLNWQPIPFDHLSYVTDLWFSIPTYFCPNYAKEYNQYVNSHPDGRKMQEKYATLYEHLRDSTGLNITRTSQVFQVYSCLKSQSEWGFALPEWTRNVYPKTLAEATRDGLASSVATTRLKQLSGGFILERLIRMMKQKANNTMYPEDRRMSLYSGHDLNLVYLLGALNVFTPHVVPYGACVLIELHRISGQHYVKLLYQDYTGDHPRTLTIPGCMRLCPLERFESLLQVNLPVGNNPCGDDLKVFDDCVRYREYYLGHLRYKSVIKYYNDFANNVRPIFTRAVVSDSDGGPAPDSNRRGGGATGIITAATGAASENNWHWSS